MTQNAGKRVVGKIGKLGLIHFMFSDFCKVKILRDEIFGCFTVVG